MNLPSVMNHSFSQVPRADIPRSQFDRSHGYKTTFDAGYLVPVFVDEALPGDTFNLRMSAFARLATPLKPIMDNLFMDTFFFAVPIRLIWDNWAKFNGEQTNPGDSTDYVIPTMTSPVGGYSVGGLSDYLGFPVEVAGLVHSCLWHRAYNLIWNEWFRDQNLQSSVVVNKGDGPDNPTTYAVLRRGKRHDYFTSCLPWPQKGESVDIPIGTSAPVVAAGTGVPTWTGGGASGRTILIQNAAVQALWSGPNATSQQSMTWADPKLQADLTNATAATINQLRQAFQIQKMYERDARGGTRYTELVRAHFGVVSPDARLQRPEYLGGGSTPVSVHPVAQTSESATTAQGNLAAFGVANLHGHGFTKSFTEHCVVIGLCSVRADLSYQQGLHRMFTRSTRFDFYWPALSQIGEQAVLSKELEATGVPATDEAVFGYQERYAEYRYKPSQITGKFRSTYATSLDIWHLAQDFGGTAPVLNASFIQDDPPIDRVKAVPSEPHFLFDAYYQFKCARPMPVFGVPGLIDHF